MSMLERFLSTAPGPALFSCCGLAKKGGVRLARGRESSPLQKSSVGGFVEDFADARHE